MSRLVLMGSGEIAPSLVAVHREGLSVTGATAVTLLDSPFGFQENADLLVEKIATFFANGFGVGVEVASLRSRTAGDVERAKMLAALDRARYVFSGPGSPTFALDLWEDLGISQALVSVISRGGAVTLASAAALTAGSHTIPVYEIYKVGADPYLRPGLDIAGALGLPMIVVPHWNNAEGGNHDTSRCFIGARRFEAITAGLDRGVVGIDEHTAAIFDFDSGTLRAAGLGTVTLLGGETVMLEAGGSMPLDDATAILGGRSGPATPDMPSGTVELKAALDHRDVDEILAALLSLEEQARVDPDRRSELRIGLVELSRAAEQGLIDPREVVGDYVALLLELRAAARSERRFDDADRIRDGLADLGVEVRDTPAGVEWDLRDGET